MSQQNSKIEFLTRMERRNYVLADLALFLIGEGIVPNRTVSEVMKLPPDARPAEFYVLLKKNEHLFHLVSWEWTILPQENMKLTLITHNGVKEFTWSE